MALLSDERESGSRSGPGVVALVVIVELGFGETLCLFVLLLSSAAFASRACLRPSLVSLVGLIGQSRLPPLLSSRLLRISLLLEPMAIVVVDEFCSLIGSPS